MSTPASQPNEPEKTPEKVPLTPEARRRRDLLAMRTTYLSTTPGWGERLLPYLFMAMETCWIAAILIGLASVNFFQSHEPLIPLWSPFVLMAGLHWLSAYLERRDLARAPASAHEDKASVISGSRFVFAFIAVMTLFVVWSSVYTSSAFFLDPRWLLALLNDLLLLNAMAYRVIAVIGLSVYFCLRGIRLSRRVIEPSTILRTMRVGLIVILAVIVIRAGADVGSFDEWLLLLLIPLFLSLVLLAHAIAQTLSLRRSSPSGLQGSIATQERTLLMVIGMVGVLLFLLALPIGTFASPGVLAQLQQALTPIGLAYDWLVSALAYIIIFLLTPIFWLISQLHLRLQFPRVRTPPPSGTPSRSAPPPAAVLVTVSILKIVLPLLVIVLVLLLIRWALRRRRLVLTRRQEDDVHESLWSWPLFWAQLKALLRAIWLRFFPRRATGGEESPASASLQGGEPMARSIREIYRGLLRWAAGRGYPRKKHETPYEFSMRLNERLPQAEAELGVVTEAYTAVRYGEVVPDKDEVAQVRQMWMNLQQKYIHQS